MGVLGSSRASNHGKWEMGLGMGLAYLVPLARWRFVVFPTFDFFSFLFIDWRGGHEIEEGRWGI